MLAASAVLMSAQEKAAPTRQGPQKTVLIEVKNGDVMRIGNVVSGLGAQVRSDPTLRMIAVSGDLNAVTAIEEAIKRMDVAPAPQRNVELTMYLLYASAQEVPNATVPAVLDATVKELRAGFPYKSYRVLDSNVLRARDGERAQVSGTLPGRGSYDFQYNKATISGQTPRILRIDNLQMVVRLNDSERGGSITTNLDVKEGQKTVVGKANVAASEDAIFLVITPKVVE